MQEPKIKAKENQSMEEEPSSVPNKEEGFAFIFFKNFFITFWSYFLIYNVWWLLGMVKGQWPIETSINAFFKSGGVGIVIGLLYSIYEARKPILPRILWHEEISEGRYVISKKKTILCILGIITFITWICTTVVFIIIASRS